MPAKVKSRRKPYELELVERRGQTLVRADSRIKGQQALFLECLALRAPGVLTALQDDVLPLFENVPTWIKQRRAHGPEVPKITIGGPLRKVKFTKLPDTQLCENLCLYSKYPQVHDLEQGLHTWAKRFDLNTTWVLDAALSTLHCWADPAQDPRKKTRPHVLYGSALYFTTLLNLTWYKDERPPVQYHHSNWRSGETWAEFERTQLAEFKVHLKRHGLETLQHGYSLDSSENADHLSWIALAYGRRLNFRQIADLPVKERDGHLELQKTQLKRGASSINIQAIQKAVQEKAKLIGLPQLRATLGRPKKRQPARSRR